MIGDIVEKDALGGVRATNRRRGRLLKHFSTESLVISHQSTSHQSPVTSLPVTSNQFFVKSVRFAHQRLRLMVQFASSFLLATHQRLRCFARLAMTLLMVNYFLKHVVYRRTREEMPAGQEEIDEAEWEGIQIQYLISPIRILSSDGKKLPRWNVFAINWDSRIPAAGDVQSQLKVHSSP